MSHVACHLMCAIQLLIHGIGPLREALVEIGRSKKQGNSFLALLGNFIDDYHQSHENGSECCRGDSGAEVGPMDPAQFYKLMKEKTSIDPYEIGDAVTAMRRILQAIRSAATGTSPAFDELFKALLAGKLRQDIVGHKRSLQRIKSKDREMACPMAIPGGLESVELGLAQATTNRQFINGFDWDQVSNYVESDLLTDCHHDTDDGHEGSWETFKVTRFLSLPRCLLLHLERFSYSSDGSLRPINETVDVHLTIDMRNYMCDCNSDSSYQYSLEGAILHVLDRDDEDDNEEGGHYVSVHLMEDDTWYLVDDEVVSRIPSVDIPEFLSGRPCTTAGTKHTFIAVLLLYCCRDADVSSHMLDRFRTELAEQGQSDEQSLIGKRLMVKWAKEKWYAGVVSGYDETTGKHSVLYDDGDVREYDLQKKVVKWE